MPGRPTSAHPTPCGIKVTNSDLWFPVDGYGSRGVEGVDVTTGWGSVSGDSGGTVFGVASGRNRQARGIVSARTAPPARLEWTD